MTDFSKKDVSNRLGTKENSNKTPRSYIKRIYPSELHKFLTMLHKALQQSGKEAAEPYANEGEDTSFSITTSRPGSLGQSSDFVSAGNSVSGTGKNCIYFEKNNIYRIEIP